MVFSNYALYVYNQYTILSVNLFFFKIVLTISLGMRLVFVGKYYFKSI
ncbi:hypothetical protein T190607A01A_60084 [Tenacibaculum sp. 190524A05c]|uniref:Uncharacterized protein n=1 Tax=Tenacibaculum platacis TaxID=3137852 RepID=A0ABM9P5P3_9FLAO